ncbi:sulfatase [Rhodopirellula sp. JC740]|uniref:Sulfatase n=1 Tax=Rhodopirellula halodulae TaxID=2894198 RepID=A0ABS8NF23_9BACT|nr:sulfatase [Rhodopirellula sp. JC740]MCC9642150.1 sulfatase [Rhodopirellula sp. JC740]
MLIFTLEGFTPAAISAYGSSWNRTPTLDRIAAHGVTWNRVITPVTDPLEQWDRWASQLGEAAREIVVITDDERLLQRDSAAVFEEIVLVESEEAAFEEDLGDDSPRTIEIEDTTLGRLTAVAADRLNQDQSVWLHSRFLTRHWDAPRELSDDFESHEAFDEEPYDESEDADEFGEVSQSLGTDADADADPQDEISPNDLAEVPWIISDTEPPDRILAANEDPDWITTWMRTYACQIKLVDAMMDVLLSLTLDETPLLISGTSGFALGQNGGIGHRTGPLRSCHLQVPLICSGGTGLRRRLLTSADDFAKLVNARQLHVDDPLVPIETFLESSPPRQQSLETPTNEAENASLVVIHRDASPVAVMTHEWFYIRSEDGPLMPDADDRGHLFLKPDDIDDFNNVIRLQRDEADRLHQFLLSDSNPAE